MPKKSNIVDLSKFDQVWRTVRMLTPCCNYGYQAVIHEDAKEIECPNCNRWFHISEGER